jgi:hypothetical protein
MMRFAKDTVMIEILPDKCDDEGKQLLKANNGCCVPTG